ncbi:MAG: HNH endonuclease [Fusobacteriaceae bacterium]
MSRLDYRNTEYCESFSKIKRKKKELLKKIRQNHSTPNLHPLVKDVRYKNDYLEAYNYKCSYCGASLNNMPINFMEVDHFIYEASFNPRVNAGKIENLVLACFACNRRKSSFVITGIYERVLHPDSRIVRKIFFRDEDYRIKINPKLTSDNVINEFYDKLSLGSELRRLDFILLRIDGLLTDPSAAHIKSDLLESKNELTKKRNAIDVYK